MRAFTVLGWLVVQFLAENSGPAVRPAPSQTPTASCGLLCELPIPSPLQTHIIVNWVKASSDNLVLLALLPGRFNHFDCVISVMVFRVLLLSVMLKLMVVATKLRPCKIAGVVDELKCGEIEVVENRSQPNSRSIKLKVVILPADANQKRPDPTYVL